MPYHKNRWWEPFYNGTIFETVGGSASPAYLQTGYLTKPAGVAGLSSASDSDAMQHTIASHCTGPSGSPCTSAPESIATTGWMGENHFRPVPVALYGCVLLMAATAYTILIRVLLKSHGAGSALAKAIGSDFKGNVSLAGYVCAIPLAFVHEWISMGLYFAVAVVWFIPDRRIESVLKE